MHLSSALPMAYASQQVMATGAQSGNENSDRLNVFLCHSSADKALIRELCVRLESNGVQPWLDEKNLLGGQDFQQEIRRAVRSSDVVVICLSNNSITKSGFVQREIKYAMELAEEQPEGALFLIPLRLEECNVPQSLSKLHWIDYFKADGYQQLRRALDFRAQALKKNPTSPSAQSNPESLTTESQPVDTPARQTTSKDHSSLVYAMSLGLLAGAAIVGFGLYQQSVIQPIVTKNVDFNETRNTSEKGIGVIDASSRTQLSFTAEIPPGDFSQYKVFILDAGNSSRMSLPISPSRNISPNAYIFFQTGRNDKNCSFGLFLCHVKGNLDFFLNVSLFSSGALRKTYDDHVTSTYSGGNLLPPILTRYEILLIKPWCKTILF